MRFSRKLDVVGVHAEGEVGDVIVGGVLDVPGSTMYDKMMCMWEKNDGIRQLLLNEPRGRASMSTNLILPPCNPKADVGLIILESEEYVPMSGSNTICAVTALLETGMVNMVEPTTRLSLDTAAGLVLVEAKCLAGKCKSVRFENAPSFVFGLDIPINVPDLGTITVDVAYGGMMCAFVDAAVVDQQLEDHYKTGAELVKLGEKIKSAVRAQFTPVHPENSAIRGVTNLVFTAPLATEVRGMITKNAAVVMPGRLDRSPCGTGTCARMAVLHARGMLAVGDTMVNRSIINTEFIGRIVRTTEGGKYRAIVPTIEGRGWITSFKQVVLDPEDPFPEGFRVGDAWLPANPNIKEEVFKAYKGST
ncbi:proline racemase [Plenodomus tracheiphilus IPT5]|uniref:Proline racemase n=1 Tax=Plenodomus tracheiphilus IPT5 TaxID=1408161 RepID=A0A6A7ASU5_9PLEO|nr:proline racemase [Plenodomus tracheiphilus IPT5]